MDGGAGEDTSTVAGSDSQVTAVKVSATDDHSAKAAG